MVKATEVEIALLIITAILGILGFAKLAAVTIIILVVLMFIHGFCNPERAEKWSDWFWGE